jgi:hypothetical protein
MASVVVTHGVGNMDVWLKAGAEREELFAPFASSYRIYREKDSDRVAVVSEGVDLKKMEAALSTPEMQAAMKAHTVLDPVFFIEVPGGK